MNKNIIWEHFYSSDYCYFLPAIVVCTIWMLLPIPEIAKHCLFLWSLPLFTAGAAYSLHQGQDTLLQLIHRRCPVQGVIILFYTLGGVIVFFTLLLLSEKMGLIGTLGRESIFVAFLGGSTVMILSRLWPDYLLRVITPWPGSTDSWIGRDPWGLGPGPWTSWRYTGRGGLPLTVTAGAVFSLLVIAGSFSILFSSLFQDHGGIWFLLFVAALTVVFPLAHLFLARAGYLLLAANDITLKAPARKAPDVTGEVSPSPPQRKRPKVFDDHALIDERAYDELQEGESIITGWLYKENSKPGRQWNGVVGYNETDDKVVFYFGPHGGGHWGHEGSYAECETDRALMGWFPERIPIPEQARKAVVRFLKDRQHVSSQ